MTQCPSCSAGLRQDAKFCPKCGQPVEARGANPSRASASVPTWMYVTTVVALCVGMWGAYEAGSSRSAGGPAPSMTPQTSAPVMPPPSVNSRPGDPRIEAIASRFLCSCGNCGDDTVWACDCEHPNGALEVKGFIANQLAQGTSVDAVTELVKKKYGGFIR